MKYLVQVSSEVLSLWQEELGDHQLELRPLGEDVFFTSSKSLAAKDIWATVFPRFIFTVEAMWDLTARGCTPGEYAREAVELAQNLLMKCENQYINVIATKVWLGKRARNIENLLLERTRGANRSNQRGPWTLVVSEPHLFFGESRSTLSLRGSKTWAPFVMDSNKNKDSISRASKKLSEVWSLMDAAGIKMREKACWLELGAAPGGMTGELFNKGYEVFAVDKSFLHPSISKNPLLRFVRGDILDFDLPDQCFDGIICDANGPPSIAIKAVLRAIPSLAKSRTPVIFTLKMPSWADYRKNVDFCSREFSAAGLNIIDIRHLFHNRQEVTVLAVTR